jgi:hypothetical protein
MVKAITRFVIPAICAGLIIVRSWADFNFGSLVSRIKWDPTTVTLIVIGVLSGVLGYVIPRVLRLSKPFRDKTTPRTAYTIVLSVISLTLVLLHGLAGDRFIVDVTTVILLGVASLPLVQEYLSSIKAGNIELTFRELSVHDQIFVFLDGIVRQQPWTFYRPRQGEAELGPAFVLLVRELIEKEDRKLRKLLKEWLNSNNDNLMYFASEVIGYFNLKFAGLKADLTPLFKDLDPNSPWYTGQLNSLWAYSRYNGYRSLNDFLLKTTDEENQRWVLVAYEQMIGAGHAKLDDFAPTIDKFINEGAVGAVKEKA